MQSVWQVVKQGRILRQHMRGNCLKLSALTRCSSTTHTSICNVVAEGLCSWNKIWKFIANCFNFKRLRCSSDYVWECSPSSRLKNSSGWNWSTGLPCGLSKMSQSSSKHLFQFSSLQTNADVFKMSDITPKIFLGLSQLVIEWRWKQFSDIWSKVSCPPG